MKGRYLLWITWPGALMLVLMWRNTTISDLYHLQRVQPFVLIDIAKSMMIAVLLIQHAGPPPGVPWWRVWRWVDPVVLVLVGTTVPSIIYYLMLVGGNSQRFRAPEWGYDSARMLMWVFGYIAIAVWCELAYRGIRARRRQDTRRRSEYDLRDANGGEAGQ